MKQTAVVSVKNLAVFCIDERVLRSLDFVKNPLTLGLAQLFGNARTGLVSLSHWCIQGAKRKNVCVLGEERTSPLVKQFGLDLILVLKI